MSIKTEILSLQHIRIDLAMKIVEIQDVIVQAKASDVESESSDVESESSDVESEYRAGCKSALQDLQALYNEASHELQTNPVYTRTYPALCAIGMPADVRMALLGEQVSNEAKTGGESKA